MPVTYEKCPNDVAEIIESMLKAHHPDLSETNAQVHAYYAIPETNEDGESSTPPVKWHGYAVAAKVKINAYRERVEGKPDATIYLDKEEWDEMVPADRDAWIDKCLQCLEQVRDPADPKIPKKDDLGRPRLKYRKFDHVHLWFNAIASRHGDHAPEIQEAKFFAERNGQLYWGWDAPPGGNGTEQLTFNSGSAVNRDTGTFADGPRAKHFHTPADLQLKPGDLSAACHPGLVSVATKGTNPELRTIVKLGAMKYVVTPPPAGQPEDVYALRPLHNKANGEPTTADPYHGMKVLLDGHGGQQEFYVGAEAELLLAKDVDEAPLTTAGIDADKASKGRGGRKKKATAAA